MPVVYEELRDIARAQRRRYDVGSFQTTALVHEAYLRMAGQDLVPDRAYVFASAARAMRNVLVDHARRRHAAKRRRAFQRADELQVELRALGVETDDKAREWRIA